MAEAVVASRPANFRTPASIAASLAFDDVRHAYGAVESVRGVTLEIAPGAQWAVLARDARGWRVEATPDQCPPPDPAPPLPRAAALADPGTSGPSEALTSAVAALLLPRHATDLVMLADDQFWMPPGPLTAEKLLDLAVYPDGRFVRFTLPGAQVAALKEIPPYGRIRVFPAAPAAAPGKE